MTPQLLADRAARIAKRFASEFPSSTFTSFRKDADEASCDDDRRILDAVVVLLDARADRARADLIAFKEQNLENYDENVTGENMDREIVEGSIDYWPEFFRHAVAVVVSNSESSGVAVNWTPAARCVY